MFFTTALSLVFLSNFVLGTQYLKSLKTISKNNIPSAGSSCTIYKWFDPNTSSKEGKKLLKNCSSCHKAYYKEWTGDKHSMSQTNPFFLAIYKQFREDHPKENGNCVLCHNPEAALDDNFDVDLRLARSKKTSGISCDFCHKIESVDQNPLKEGAIGLGVLRVCEGLKDIRFGPIKDPIQPSKYEELRYNSLYKTSLYCAKCHDGKSGNTQIYSTFTEWAESPGAKKGVQCQSCHMKPRNTVIASRRRSNDMNSIVDNPEVKHKLRPYHQIHSHSFLTEDPHILRKEYVDLNVRAGLAPAQKSGTKHLIITVTVSNNNFGHSFPTGSPMRNALIVLEVKDKEGKDLKLVKGLKLPAYAGELEGKAGKLYAKVLAETTGEYAGTHGESGIKFRKLVKELGIPALDWWNIYIASDTRIKASESDVSTYEFAVGAGLAPAQITAKLIWRNTWPGLAKIKGFKLEEDLLIKKKIQFNPNKPMEL